MSKVKEVQPNLRSSAVLTSNSDFNMNLNIDEKAELLIEGYALRLTKKGKTQFANLPSGNLSESEEATIRMMCATMSLPFSGQGGMVYQVTVFTNTKTEESFVNTFNPNKAAGESIYIQCIQQKDKDGKGITYGTDNLPSLTLKVTSKPAENSNADLTEKAIKEAEGAKIPNGAKMSKKS